MNFFLLFVVYWGIFRILFLEMKAKGLVIESKGSTILRWFFMVTKDGLRIKIDHKFVKNL